MSTREFPGADLLVDVAGLGKSFAGRSVISGVEIRLKRGDMLGLVGANGGGKTTTLRMIAGLLRPDVGTGRVMGDDVRAARRQGLSAIGYMTQRLALYPELTVRENLQFRAEAQCLAAPNLRIAEAAVRYGLARVLNMRAASLSGGWSRRVQFAATVLHGPALLLLDEPTAGLDIVTRRDIWRWLGELSSAGCGIIISTHDLVEAESCPSLLFYDDGVAQGPLSPAEMAMQSNSSTLQDAVLDQAKQSGQ